MKHFRCSCGHTWHAEWVSECVTCPACGKTGKPRRPSTAAQKTASTLHDHVVHGDSTADAETAGQFEYGAFISYRHAPYDKWIVKRLHRRLERYRIPCALVKAGDPPRVQRIFRDQDELRAGDLTEEIREALRKSRYLIVVCSRQTPESPWVAREIEMFKALGRCDSILPLLIEGEPSEAMPPQLRLLPPRTRPKRSSEGKPFQRDLLAADIRASNRVFALYRKENSDASFRIRYPGT